MRLVTFRRQGSEEIGAFVDEDRRIVRLQALLQRGVRLTGTDGWSWDAPFVYTAERYRQTGTAALIWEGHKAGREIGWVPQTSASLSGMRGARGRSGTRSRKPSPKLRTANCDDPVSNIIARG